MRATASILAALCMAFAPGLAVAGVGAAVPVSVTFTPAAPVLCFAACFGGERPGGRAAPPGGPGEPLVFDGQGAEIASTVLPPAAPPPPVPPSKPGPPPPPPPAALAFE